MGGIVSEEALLKWCNDHRAVVAIIALVLLFLIGCIVARILNCWCGIFKCVQNVLCCCKCFKPCRKAARRKREKRRSRPDAQMLV
jgi:hypothetical protein